MDPVAFDQSCLHFRQEEESYDEYLREEGRQIARAYTPKVTSLVYRLMWCYMLFIGAVLWQKEACLELTETSKSLDYL